MRLARHLRHPVNIVVLFMKVLSHLIAVFLVGSLPVQARIKDQFEDAVLECMSSPSESVCMKAAESADTYAARLFNSDRKCVVYIGIVGATAATAPFMGQSQQLIDEWNRYREICG